MILHFIQSRPLFSGYKNNVIKVQKADFDAFEALDMDSAAVAKAAAHKRQQQVRPYSPDHTVI